MAEYLYSYLKQRAYDIFESEAPDPNDKLNKLFDWIIIIFVILSVTSVIIETVPSVYSNPSIMSILRVIEIISIAVFSLEYIIRLWCVTCDQKYSHPFWGRLRFIFSFMPIIDLIAIIPFYLALFGNALNIDLRFVRILRLVRFMRVLKLARYSKAMQNILRVINKKKADILVALSIVILLVLLSSSLLYFIEHDAQPEKFSSIPESMWWAICTLTTVGYGDIFPITWLGKIITALITLLSIGLIALPAGIVVSGFQEIAAEDKEEERNSEIFAKLKHIEDLLQEKKSL
jgi:voltage-gated potassium channel